ncbi:tripartite tricarboxylate transporter substrate binding protein [Nitratireductor aquimarinus]|uniref:Bug family tripartite tricarboxylate transporter substrate binding protein n=1 Tax=Nitratireductor aquimarinus TaxID=889300 RepID=UPI001A8DB5AC|nr:tripartite tricarboxylate transporter substrate binding protein [Nitratireductor aquimarinus]MBN8245729.1 tripartite tricarboxylate transporter substrate binding protein [Nitratireductor aquimarinus]MBY6134110.1 tripartite tricarboxylate transporter substrate binding protein [Nitratireductor aquimarinus]MCA1305199.1 tripartite tricarboxylate transporter substrate binding protein [Nitratireductor aquimarinus]
MMIRKRVLSFMVAAALLMTPALAEYPERPLTLIVPYGAGGGTDFTGRVVASLLEEKLGQPVNVINRTGAIGLVGHTEIVNAEPDGYTLGVVTFELGTYKWLGTSGMTPTDFDAVALYNFDASAVNVAADSKFESFKQIVEAIKADPRGTYKIGAPPGGNSHAALAGALLAAGVDTSKIVWVPVKGGADAMTELAAGGIDMTATSLPESQPMREAGQVKALAVLSDARYEAFPDVPTVREEVGVDWTGGTWRGIAAPVGLSEDVKADLVKAMQEVLEDPRFAEQMNSRGFRLKPLYGQDFSHWMEQSYESTGETFKKIGLTK